MALERSGEIGCHNCIGACCRKRVAMELTSAEAKFMADSGTLLKTLIAPESVSDFLGYRGDEPEKRELKEVAYRMREGHGLFGLESDCGNLALDSKTGQGICKVHSDSRRPKVCSEFKVDSLECNAMRRSAGLPSRSEARVVVRRVL